MFFKSAANKCGHCKSSILYEPGAEVGFCEYCGMMQTLERPESGDESDKTAEPEAVPLAEQIALCLKRKADRLTFGRYVQKPDGEPEPIEWQVLARKKDRILVLSKYALDSRFFNVCHDGDYDGVTWETCSLRSWLNGEFLDFAFSEEEKALIPAALVRAGVNPEYDTDPGSGTTDRVFLLSVREVEQYLGPDYDRRICYPTAYCNYVLDKWARDNWGCDWFLRSPGGGYGGDYSFRSKRVAYVKYDGWFELYGSADTNLNVTVRPALWLTPGP